MSRANRPRHTRPLLFRVALLMLLAATGGFGGKSSAQTPLEWIDVHVHLLGGGGVRSDFAGAARAAVAAMDEAGIRASVVMPPPQVDNQDPRGRHDIREFADSLKAYPGRFAFLGGGGTLNPMLMRFADSTAVDANAKAEFEQAAREILAAGAAGFGEIAAHHLSHAPGHPYESVAADHPLLLLLADIAAQYGAVIDLHFDAVLQDMNLPPRYASPPNPQVLRANFSAFERLLAHNRKARIVWAHAGSDQLGFWTPALSRELLKRHPNLTMSLRFPAGLAMGTRKPPGGRPEGMMQRGQMGGPKAGMMKGGMQPPGPMGGPPMGGQAPDAGGMMPPHFAMNAQHEVSPQWIELMREFPDRFVLGGDQFIPAPSMTGAGPGLSFARLSPIQREMTRKFLSALPPETARQIAIENPMRLYKIGGAR